MSNLDVVNSFLKVAAQRDYDAARALVTDDLEYQNMMLPPVIGKDAMVETLEFLLAMCESSEWKVLREVANGDLVMNERVDSFVKDGVSYDLPVAGVFQLREGKIAVWHDYFDLATITTAMGL